jgi:flagellar FliL protein
MPAAEDAEPAAPAARRSYVTAIVITIGLLGGGAFGTLLGGPLLAHRFAKTASAAAVPPAEEPSGTEAPAQADVLVDNLVLNPAGSGGMRFLLVTVGLRLSNSDKAIQLKSRDAEVRDAILRVLGNKRIDELADIGMRDALKMEISTALDTLLGSRGVKGVYFPQFVLQ